MNEEHNMTLREKIAGILHSFQKDWRDEGFNDGNSDPLSRRAMKNRYTDEIVSQFDAMLAEDIEKMDNKIGESSIEYDAGLIAAYDAGLIAAIDILEARRRSIIH